MDWPLSREEVSLFFSPAGLIVVAPLPDDQFRVVATVDDPPEQPDAAYIQGIIDARGPVKGERRIRQIVWGSRFYIQHKVVTTLRSGRVLVCGDAAHVHSPAGGQGMNTGIQDSISLAEPLIRALTKDDASGLDA